MKFNFNNPFKKNDRVDSLVKEAEQTKSFSEIKDGLQKRIIKNNWDKNGSLGVTVEDHILIGSTPEDILVKNPGKTLGELMSDLEINEFIRGTLKNIEENKKYSHLKNFNMDLIENLILSVEYLKSIRRLPKDFDLDDIEK